MAQSIWTTKANLINSGRRYQAGGAFDSNYALSCGGEGGGGSDKTEIYDKNADAWADKAVLNTGRFGLAAAGFDSDNILSFGGENGSGKLNATELYSKTGNTWTTKTSLLQKRVYLTGSTFDSNYALSCGGMDASPLDATELYDKNGNAWTTKTNLNTARRGLAAAGFDSDAMLSFGGGVYVASELYSKSANAWTNKTNLNVGADFTAGARLDSNYALLFGGFRETAEVATTESYSKSANAWTSETSLNVARYGLGGAGLDNLYVLSFGGYSFSSGTVITELYESITTAINITSSENVSLSDSASTNLPNQPFIAESVGMSDIAFSSAPNNLSLLENTIAADTTISSLLILAAAATDNIGGMSDVASSGILLRAMLSENVAITETMPAFAKTLLECVLSENASPIDAIFAKILLRATIADVIGGLTENIEASIPLEASITDSIVVECFCSAKVIIWLDNTLLYIAEIYDIQLITGDMAYYTSHDSDLVYGGNVYTAIPIKRNTVKTNSNLQVDNVVVEFALSGLSINSTPLFKIIKRNWLSNAQVTIRQINYQSLTDERILFDGWVTGDIQYSQESVKMKVGSILDKLNDMFPKYLYQSPCNHKVFSSECGLIKNNWKETGSATNSVPDVKTIQSSVFAYANKPSGYFLQGEIKITAGTNNGVSRIIKNHNDGNVEVYEPFDDAVDPGTSFEAYPGDDKSAQTCAGRFNNIVNFMGFETLRDPDTVWVPTPPFYRIQPI